MALIRAATCRSLQCMKCFLVCTVLLFLAAAAFADTLVTPSFVVVIIHNDPEGTVSSNNITYVGVSRKTGDTIRLKGRTVHRMDADGVTPGRFLGYTFENEKVSYFVSENGGLKVMSSGRVILEEAGKWVGDD